MRIFVSSTFKDLRPERESAQEALRRSELVPWGMELFVSEPSKPLDVCLEADIRTPVVWFTPFWQWVRKGTNTDLALGKATYLTKSGDYTQNPRSEDDECNG